MLKLQKFNGFENGHGMDPIETQIVFVRNLPKSVDKDLIMRLFGEYGSIMQIRIGNEVRTEGTAFVVYGSVECARKAIRHMNGYYLEEKYLNAGYWQPFDKFRWMVGRK
ncbi:hypothetical protein OCOL_001342 [Ordospora colligata]